MRRYVIMVMMLVIAAGAASADEIRIGVMEFSSGTMELLPEQAIVVGNIFTQRLAMSAPDNISIIGHGYLSRIAEDNQMSTEGFVSDRDAAKIGRLAGCNYIIAGVVTDLKSRRASTGVNLIVQLGRTIDVATAGADIRLIDVEAGQTVLSVSDSARATQRDSSFNIPVGVDFSRSDLNNAMQAASMYLLSYRLSLRIIEKITGEYPEVSSVSGKEVVLNAGTRSGARNGMLYLILTGESDSVAVVKVKEAGEQESKALIYGKGYGNISLARKGDRVFPTDVYEVAPLVKKKLFIKKRPAQAVEKSDIDQFLAPEPELPPEPPAEISADSLLQTEDTLQEQIAEPEVPAKKTTTKKTPAKSSSTRKRRKK